MRKGIEIGLALIGVGVAILGIGVTLVVAPGQTFLATTPWLVAGGALIALGITVMSIALLVATVSWLRSDMAAHRRARRMLLHGVPALPSRFVKRPGVYDGLRGLLLAKLPPSAPHCVAVVGMGGAGKTVLAIAAGHDRAVAKRYRDGVLWITVGQSPSLPALQTRLAHLLGKTDVAYTDTEVGKTDLRALLSQRACLLIVDDVWDKGALDALSCVGDEGALMFTTRDAGIARALLEDASRVEVMELELDQARELMAHWVSTAGQPMLPGQLPPIADSICMEVGNLALAVALCGGMISAEGNTPEAWGHVLGALRNADLEAIAVRYPPDQYPHANLLAAVELSVDALTVKNRRRYVDLGVFAGRGLVPTSAVQTVWGTTSDEARLVLGEFVDRSLVQRADDGRVILHDLQYDVARTLIASRPDGLKLANLQLVEGYRSQCEGGLWPAGPDDGYFFENLAYHLGQADLGYTLGDLLLDYGWLRTRLETSGVVALLADYSHRPPPPALEEVQRALQLSAPFLAKDPARLPGQLTGRLVGSTHPQVHHMLEMVKANAARPWLCPLTPSLTPGGGPLERVLLGHTLPVSAVTVTSDGTRVVSGGDDDTVRIWDLATGRLELTLTCHTNGVAAVTVTPDGARVVSGGIDNTVRIWNIASGRLERTLRGHTKPVRIVAVTPDGARVVSGSGRTMRVWDLASGRLERSLMGSFGEVSALAVTPDSARIVSGDNHKDNHALRVWDLATGHLEFTLEGRIGAVRALAVTPDGARVASGGDDCSVHVWNLATGDLEFTLDGHTGPVRSVAVTSDGARVASGGDDSTVLVWDLKSKSLEYTLEGHTRGALAVAATPDCKRIVSAGADCTVRIWDPWNRHVLGALEGHQGGLVNAVSIVGEAARIVSGGWDCTLRIWDVPTGSVARIIRVNLLQSAAGEVRAIGITPDGTEIVAAIGKTLQIWDVADGHLENSLLGHTGSILAVAIMATGSRIVSGGEDRTVRVWRVADGAVETTFDNQGEAVTALAITPDDAMIVCGGANGNIRVWGLAHRRLLHTLVGQGGAVRAIAIVPHRRQVVSASEDHSVRVWDLVTGDLVRSVPFPLHEIHAFAATAQGTNVISTVGAFTVRVSELESGDEIASWTPDPGISVGPCCAASADPTLVGYGDSVGRAHILRLLVPESGEEPAEAGLP